MTLPEHQLASNEYGKYCVPLSSKERPAAAAVLTGKVWEPRTIAFMATHCGDGDVVHAGAYFGDFLPALSQALAPGARLWAFEPSEENHACAAETVALNALANVSLFKAGLGPRAGTASLCISKPGGESLGGASTITRKEHRRRGYEEVQMMSLDDVVGADRKVSILQLDVEGYEQKALKGAQAILNRCKPLLILENLPRNPRWQEKNLTAIGYREIGRVHGNSVLSTTEAPADFQTYRDRQETVRRPRRGRKKTAS
ncbi:MAG TPA: FkbM family methyltransferase [Rhizomicrobium sp.]|nr:FkbM family methyltransferase [Rhizomicrobium sp.]